MLPEIAYVDASKLQERALVGQERVFGGVNLGWLAIPLMCYERFHQFRQLRVRGKEV